MRALACAIAAAALCACGGGSPQEQVVEAVREFGEAVRERDYDRLCDELLARELLAKLDTVGLPCRAALARGLSDVQDPSLRVLDVKLRGESLALVRVRTSAANQEPSVDVMRVVREEGDWRIASLTGQSPPPARPRTNPRLPPNPPAGPPAPERPRTETTPRRQRTAPKRQRTAPRMTTRPQRQRP